MIRSSTFEQVFWNQIPPENLMSTFLRRALGNEQTNSYLHFETGNDTDIREHLAGCGLRDHQQLLPHLFQHLSLHPGRLPGKEKQKAG